MPNPMALARRPGSTEEIYNLKDDRNELNNVAKDHPDIVERLDQAWRNWALRVNAAPKGRWQDRGYRTPRE